MRERAIPIGVAIVGVGLMIAGVLFYVPGERHPLLPGLLLTSFSLVLLGIQARRRA